MFFVSLRTMFLTASMLLAFGNNMRVTSQDWQLAFASLSDIVVIALLKATGHSLNDEEFHEASNGVLLWAAKESFANSHRTGVSHVETWLDTENYNQVVLCARAKGGLAWRNLKYFD